LTLLGLGRGLSVVLAHVRVVGGAETNGGLLAFVANVDSNQHGLVRDLRAELHTPKIATKFSVHLADDVQEDSVIVLSDSAVGNELANHGGIAVDLVLKEGVEVLVVGVVRHNHQEDELSMLDCAS